MTLYGNAGLDLDAHDHLDARFNAIDLRIRQAQERVYASDAVAGVVPLDFSAPGALHSHFASLSGSIGLTHTDGANTLASTLSLSEGDIHAQTDARCIYQSPATATFDQNLIQTAGFPELDLTIDYTSVLPSKATVRLGYEVKLDRQVEGNQNLQGASMTSTEPLQTFTQKFRFDQQVQAIYVDYQQVIGRLTFKPGLRVEATTLDTDLLTSEQKNSQSYLDVFPSLHLDYALDDASQFSASYGRRVLRPDESQLDPFRIFNSPTLYTAGDPELRPTFTQSFEAGYEYRRKTTDLQATLFYRDHSNVITTATQDLGSGVLLATFRNLDRATDAGLELVVKRDLSRTLTLSASTDLMHVDVSAIGLGATGRRSAYTASGQATVNWQVTRKDFVQLGAQVAGRELTGQGYRGAAIDTDLGWRHRFDDRLATVFTATDPFGLARRTSFIESAEVFELERRKFNPVAVFIGVTFAFSGGKSDANAFDFGPSPQDKP